MGEGVGIVKRKDVFLQNVYFVREMCNDYSENEMLRLRNAEATKH